MWKIRWEKKSSLCCILFLFITAKGMLCATVTFPGLDHKDHKKTQRPQKDTKTTKNRDFQVFFFEGSSIDEFVVRSEN